MVGKGKRVAARRRGIAAGAAPSPHASVDRSHGIHAMLIYSAWTTRWRVRRFYLVRSAAVVREAARRRRQRDAPGHSAWSPSRRLAGVNGAGWLRGRLDWLRGACGGARLCQCWRSSLPAGLMLAIALCVVPGPKHAGVWSRPSPGGGLRSKVNSARKFVSNFDRHAVPHDNAPACRRLRCGGRQQRQPPARTARRQQPRIAAPAAPCVTRRVHGDATSFSHQAV